MGSGEESSRFLLSVVIPSYNEGPEILLFLKDVRDYLDTRGFGSEILVVDDASTDGTYDLLVELERAGPYRVFRNAVNRGKGYSVRKGVLASKGDYILTMDADNAYSISALDDFLMPLRKGTCHIALGNRRIPNSRFVLSPKFLPYVYVRHLTGIMFNRIVQRFLLSGFSDTQCGYKCFRRDAAMRIFRQLRILGFCFDVEVLVLASEFGYACIDIPVTFRYNGEPSSIRLFPHTFIFLRDLFLIRRNRLRGVYAI